MLPDKVTENVLGLLSTMKLIYLNVHGYPLYNLSVRVKYFFVISVLKR